MNMKGEEYFPGQPQGPAPTIEDHVAGARELAKASERLRTAVMTDAALLTARDLFIAVATPIAERHGVPLGVIFALVTDKAKA